MCITTVTSIRYTTQEFIIKRSMPMVELKRKIIIDETLRRKFVSNLINIYPLISRSSEINGNTECN